MSTPVEQIKERLDILDVVGSYVQLQKAGRQYKGKSPFTNEKTPSFFVSPERGMYYCFSSGKGGDIFRFIEEMEGVDFKGALKMLAERAHVELVPQNPQKRTEQETLYALLDAACSYFETTLKKNPAIHAYLKTRGVSDRSIAKWRIGYAPAEWRALKDHLAQKGFTDAMMQRSGLVKRATEGRAIYDTFRDRVMFPIADPVGRVVAFSGRTMTSDPALPKYVNSPETELYEKSHILFGYHIAKQSIRHSNFSLIVEGQFDLVLAHQAGFSNTVAISGTALSLHHTELLERLSPRVVLALDADRAGINSVRRSAHLMLARGMDVKVATLPEGKDPADLVAEDPALLKAAVRNAVTVVEFLMSIVRKSARDERAFRLRVRDEVLPFIVRIPNRIDREHFEQVVSAELGTTKEAVHYELEGIEARISAEVAGRLRRQSPSDVVETQVITGTRAGTLRTDELVQFLYGIILWQEGKAREAAAGSGTVFDTADLRAALEDAVGADAWQSLSDTDESEKNKLVFEAERFGAERSLAELLAQFHGQLKDVRAGILKRALQAARERLREAEQSGDAETVNAALLECAALGRQIGSLIGNFNA